MSTVSAAGRPGSRSSELASGPAWPWVGIVLRRARSWCRRSWATRSRQDRPLDPSATSPDGAKALRLLLEQQGVSVDVGADPALGPTDGVALMLHDQLDAGSRAALTGMGRARGTLVVADPRSELAGCPLRPERPAPAASRWSPAPLVPACREPAFADIDHIDATGQSIAAADR